MPKLRPWPLSSLFAVIVATGQQSPELPRVSRVTAQCWGHIYYGGNCSSIDFRNVTNVYSTWYAFMALNKATGVAQCWGLSTRGGDCAGFNFQGVTDVYSTWWAFMALNRNSGVAQCW